MALHLKQQIKFAIVWIVFDLAHENREVWVEPCQQAYLHL